MELFEKNILQFPDQLTLAALEFSDLDKLRGKPDAVVLCGMGGSGLPATLLQNLRQYASIPLPLTSYRDFGLPAIPFKNPLFIFVSFSGNTAETLSGLRLASRAKLKAVVTGGGELLRVAQEQNLPRAVFPQGDLPPRQGVGYMLYGLLGILKTIFPEVKAPDLSSRIDPVAYQAIAEKLATNLSKKTVFIYTSTAASHIGQLIKINLNETGKTLAAANTFPEINHNELTAFESNPKQVAVLLALTESESANQLVEVPAIKTILAEHDIPVETVAISGQDPLEEAMNGLILANWLGFYLAKLQGLDPMSLKTVERLKKLTAK